MKRLCGAAVLLAVALVGCADAGGSSSRPSRRGGASRTEHYKQKYGKGNYGKSSGGSSGSHSKGGSKSKSNNKSGGKSEGKTEHKKMKGKEKEKEKEHKKPSGEKKEHKRECQKAWVKGQLPLCFSSMQGCGDGGWGWTNRIHEGAEGLELWAGAEKCETRHGQVVGGAAVNVSHGGMELTIEMHRGWELEEAAVWVGSDKLPQKSAGEYSASTERFPYKTARGGEHRFRFRGGAMPSALYLAMQVEVCEVDKVETTPVPAPAPVPGPGPEPEPEPEEECVVGWVKGEQAECFRGMRNCERTTTAGELGWTNVVSRGPEVLDIVAGAQECNGAHGFKAGEVGLEVDQEMVALTIDIEDGWAVEEASMWIGRSKLPQKKYGRYSASPAHFPYKTSRGGEHKFRFRGGIPSSLHLALHVKVCRVERTVAPTPAPGTVMETAVPATPVTPMPGTTGTAAPGAMATLAPGAPIPTPVPGAPVTMAPAPTPVPQGPATLTPGTVATPAPGSVTETAVPSTPTTPMPASPVTMAPAPTAVPQGPASLAPGAPIPTPVPGTPVTLAPAPTPTSTPSTTPVPQGPATLTPGTVATPAPGTVMETAVPATPVTPMPASPVTMAPAAGTPAPECVEGAVDVGVLEPAGEAGETLVDWGAGVPVEEGLPAWPTATGEGEGEGQGVTVGEGQETSLTNIPAGLQRAGTEAYFPTDGRPIESGSRLRVECPESCTDAPCEVVVATYHCPPCSSATNGGLPMLLPEAGWNAGECAPTFKTFMLGNEFGMVAFRKLVPAGTVLETPALAQDLTNVAVFVRRGATDCAAISESGMCAQQGDECVWEAVPAAEGSEAGSCVSNWCPAGAETGEGGNGGIGEGVACGECVVSPGQPVPPTPPLPEGGPTGPQ